MWIIFQFFKKLERLMNFLKWAKCKYKFFITFVSSIRCSLNLVPPFTLSLMSTPFFQAVGILIFSNKGYVIKIAGRNINNLRYADDTTLMAESEEELKSLLMKVKEESGKTWFKAQHSANEDHGIQSHHFIANRWGNGGNSGWLYFWGLQNHCRWWLPTWN